MTIEAEDAAEQVGAEAVHHRHDDDQGGDPEGDPEKGKDRDNRNEPLLPSRPQIAERDHPLERVEDHADPRARLKVAGRSIITCQKLTCTISTAANPDP